MDNVNNNTKLYLFICVLFDKTSVFSSLVVIQILVKIDMRIFICMIYDGRFDDILPNT